MIIVRKSFTRSLRHKVVLQKKTLTADGAGGYTSAWEDISTLWASIERMRGGERLDSGQLSMQSSYIFKLRYNDDIQPDRRFSFDSRIFNIRAIHNINEKKRVMEVLVEEGVAI